MCNDKIVVPTENTRALFSTLPDTDLSLIGTLCERHYQQLIGRFTLLPHVLGVEPSQKHDRIAPMLLQLQ